MIEQRTIGVVSCARADFGSLLPVLKQIRSSPLLEEHVYVTGMHLSPEFGMTVEAVNEQGFERVERVESLLSSDTPTGIAKSVGLGTVGFAQSFSRFTPDMLVILGDRFDVLAAAVAALPFNVPIAHLHGGEVTEGAFDEATRHALTKMSHLHFTATDTYARRLKQMGEEDWRIVVSGAPGLDNLLEMKPKTKEEVARRFGFDPTRRILLVTFHPVTIEYQNTKDHIDELLCALEACGEQTLFTYPNADTAGRAIIERINRFCAERDGAQVVVNAGQDWYVSLLSCVDGMVGNSSSGIIEAASFALPVVNVGIRQRGRLRGPNVDDSGHDRGGIEAAIRRILAPEFKRRLKGQGNPYGDGNASDRIIKRLEGVEIDRRLMVKKFVDRMIEA